MPVKILCCGKANANIHWWLIACDRVSGRGKADIHAARDLAASASAFQQTPDHIVFRFHRNIYPNDSITRRVGSLQFTGEAARALCR